MFKDIAGLAQHDTSFQRFQDMAVLCAVWNQAKTSRLISRKKILVFDSHIHQDLRNVFFA